MTPGQKHEITDEEVEQARAATPDRSEWDDDARLPLLRILVANYARGEGTFGLTVHVDGTIVTGQAAGQGQWARAMIPAPEGDLESAVDYLADVLHHEADRWDAEDAAALDPGDSLTIKHVQFVNANVLLPGARRPVKFAAWQIPLARITGWTLGELNFASE